jgi:hypothetical protein
MTDRELSQLQKDYQAFFLGKLSLYGVNSPVELTKEKKSEFFNAVRQEWAKIKLSKKISPDRIGQKSFFQERESSNINTVNLSVAQCLKKESKSEKSDVSRIQIINSTQNIEQSDDLKIGYSPNNQFEQSSNYQYPVVKMPNRNSSLKLPRSGRTNNRGYKETEFSNQLKVQIPNLEIASDLHMVIPNFNRPYEPDIVIYDKTINLYINIEIDEPYDGYYRYPTHNIKVGEQFKQDDIRDLFFLESGWIVIRFTEKQVHLQSEECIYLIKNVIDSVYLRNVDSNSNIDLEMQWDDCQCIQWQKSNYREKYLGIIKFHKNHNYKEILIDVNENETIERIIQRTEKANSNRSRPLLAVDRNSIKYYSNDRTGNIKYISVTTLLERFFPFDLKRYIEKKAADENRTEDEVLMEFLIIRDEAAERGTYLHQQIEHHLKGQGFISDTKEFELFLEFFNAEIQSRRLQFFDAEIKFVSNKYNVSGTIDCLFKKDDKDEYIMMDWKRSKKLVIDGYPRKFGYGYALSELSHLDNSSYFKYCLQQNIYKYIAENELGLKISSMKLVVLHDEYLKYHVLNVPDMVRETKIILNSLQHKI